MTTSALPVEGNITQQHHPASNAGVMLLIRQWVALWNDAPSPTAGSSAWLVCASLYNRVPRRTKLASRVEQYGGCNVQARGAALVLPKQHQRLAHRLAQLLEPAARLLRLLCGDDEVLHGPSCAIQALDAVWCRAANCGDTWRALTYLTARCRRARSCRSLTQLMRSRVRQGAGLTLYMRC